MRSQTLLTGRFIVGGAAVCVVAGALLNHATAVAQELDKSGRYQLEEVMVVAQKKDRAENLQDVPLSVTAFDQNRLDVQFVQKLTDLSYQIPNVQLEEVGTFPGVQNFSIRGQGINSSIPSVDPTVGTFVDGVYLGTTFGVVIDMFDVESVEVLRGPQGVLFGRNVTGGAVMVNSIRPDPQGDLDVRARVLGTNKDRYNINFAVAGPLIEDKLAGRLSLYYDDDNGYFKNTNPATPFDPPTALGPAPVPIPGVFYENPATGRNVGKLETKIARPSLVWTPTDTLEFGLIAESGQTKGDGSAWADVSLQRSGELAEFTTTADEMGSTDISWNQLTFDLNWDIGPGTLTNIAGWRKVEADSTPDVDGYFFPLFVVPGDTEQDQFSNELRYAATFFENWDTTVGVYYLTQDINYRETRQIAGGATSVLPGARSLLLGGDMSAENYGVFWNNDIRFADVWTATVGIRYSDEEKKARIIQGACPDLTGASCTYDDLKGSWDNWTPKLGLQWQFVEQAQAYGYWTKGFRAGGFNFRNAYPNPPFPPFPAGIPPGPTDQEEQRMWEVGLKSDILDNRLRLNIAYFHNEIDGLQRELNLPDFIDPVGGVVVLQGTVNAGDATIKGVEFEFTAVPTDQFTIYGSVGYLDGRYTAKNPLYDIGPPLGIGDDLPRLAPWSYSIGAGYDFILGNNGILNLQGDYGYRDRNAYNDSNTEYFDEQRRLGASVNWISPEDHWRVSLFGKNLKDEANYGNLTVIPAPDRTYTSGPMQRGREYGMEVQYRL